jgi:hypothetical protein
VTPKRSRRPRLLAVVVLTAALVAAVTALTGPSWAATTAGQAEYAPANTAPPTISGTPQVGQTLTASTGTFTSSTAPTYSYQWQRCNSTGAACADIVGSTGQTYGVTSVDVGNTLRVRVTATNPSGASSSTSSQTAVVTAATATPPTTPPPAAGAPDGAIKTAQGTTSVPASGVALPARLIIDRVQFSPNPIRSRNSFVGRFRVSDTRGFVVRDALVYALGIPYGWQRTAGEVRTDTNGWATVVIRPTRLLPLQRGAFVIFVRARVQGQDLLAGTSTRRLVQVGVAPR